MTRYRRLLTYVLPYRRRLAAAILCSVAVSATTGYAALLVKPILDEIFMARDTSRLVFFPLLVMLLYIARGFLLYGQAYLMRSVGQRVIRDLRQEMFAHLQGLPMTYFNRQHTGVLMSQIIHDVTLIERAVTEAVSTGLRQGLTLLALIGVAVYRDWVLATWALLVLPFAWLCIVKLGRALRRLSRRAQEHVGALNALVAEVLGNIRVVKGFGREPYEDARFRRGNEAYYGVMMRSVRTDEMRSPIMEFLAAVGVAAVIWYGGSQVIAGTTTPGTFFSFLTAIFMIYEPVRRLSRINNTIQTALAAAARVFGLLDTPGEATQEDGKPALPPIRRALAFNDVSMRYDPGGAPALDNVSLEVPAGSVVALVGASGAGKTTLVHMIPRFYEPEKGCITIDGQDIREVSLASLRAQVGIVSQDVALFDDTVRRNILYGNPQASEEQVMTAARAAFAHDFVTQLPEGYDTRVGEGGVKFSGGEKQRLAIARALLRDAPILILDEATSALDSASERMVQQALENLLKDRTTFVIAHRLSTVRHADLIVVLHEGRIVEQGCHNDLLAASGHYRRLYDLQFRTQEPAPGGGVESDAEERQGEQIVSRET